MFSIFQAEFLYDINLLYFNNLCFGRHCKSFILFVGNMNFVFNLYFNDFGKYPYEL